MAPHTTPTRPIRALAGYLGMLALGGVAFFVVRWLGETWQAPPGALGNAGDANPLSGVMLALAAVTVLARLLGVAFERFLKQPAVIGEIVAGILLGPSALGAFAPSVSAFLFPPEVVPYLANIAKIGVVLFMFLIGLELDPKLLRRNSHTTVAISHASILAPFVLGASLALWVYPLYGEAHVPFTVFSLFMGISLSITAFPVLARILTDRRAQRTRLGVMAISCAAVGDVTAWVLLALVVGVANADLAAAWTLPLVAAYLLAMVYVVRPIFARLAEREECSPNPVTRNAMATVFVALLLSAVITESIGIHALFGAFLLGAVMPHEGRLAAQLREGLENVVVVLFLPAFFACTGLRTEIALVSGTQAWIVCGLIIVVATVGKFGGSLAAARLAGMGWREASALGVLMNSRGLMELIVLNIGLELGVISPTLFAMMVIMALVTTFATTPALSFILGHRGFADAPVRMPATQPPG